MNNNKRGITLTNLILLIVILLICASCSIVTLSKRDYIESSKIQNLRKDITSIQKNIEERKILNVDSKMQKIYNLGTPELTRKYKNKIGILNNRVVYINTKKNSLDKKEIECLRTLGVYIVTTEGVVIPFDMYYVGGKRQTGLVISTSKEDEFKGVKNTNLAGNQFVFVDTASLEKGYVAREEYSKIDKATVKPYNSVQKEECLEISESTKAYGGFYIARYEASYYKGSIASKKSQRTDLNKQEERADGMLMNFVTQSEAANFSRNIISNNTNAKTTLPYLASWDSIVAWIEKANDFSVNKASKRISTVHHAELINTGVTQESKINNIFDLAR
ncbi:MAG: hypothetical protein RSB51_03470 [Clostridia bacterium]